ncbi:MAG: class I SAM-dependent methyltransferase [Aequorivita sp.]|nr:class I SAM-dependent methyltransferase [Aequorivita sp.]
MENFKDNFSKQSDVYQRYRPSYPKKLFEYLSNLSKANELAWDCATGNGQSAIGLVDYFEKVFATDPSGQQISNAVSHPKIIYRVEKAENSSLENNSVDLITVAQALHWFDFEKFYSEVRRVLKPNGIIAVWTYGLPKISSKIDQLILHFHDNIVGEFWQKENLLVSEEYKTIPFPFREIETPAFQFQREIAPEDLKGLFFSWSATQRYLEQSRKNPVLEIENDLQKLWKKEEETKLATWNIFLKAGILE